MDEAEVVRVVRDLMVIAKVEMPPGLFAGGPRLMRARALLELAERTLPGQRPPNVTRRPLDLDLHVLASKRAVEELAGSLIWPARLGA